jgi:hypothetical protein
LSMATTAHHFAEGELILGCPSFFRQTKKIVGSGTLFNNSIDIASG